MAALNTDQPIPAELVQRILGVPNVQWARATQLSPLDQTGLQDPDMPVVRPDSPEFGSGPCKKRPGYDLAKISQRWWVCLSLSFVVEDYLRVFRTAIE